MFGSELKLIIWAKLYNIKNFSGHNLKHRIRRFLWRRINHQKNRYWGYGDLDFYGWHSVRRCIFRPANKCSLKPSVVKIIFFITFPSFTWNIFLGNFLRLSILAFFVYKINYLCWLLYLFSCSWELGFGWFLGSLFIGNTYDFQLFNLSIIWKSKY